MFVFASDQMHPYVEKSTRGGSQRTKRCICQPLCRPKQGLRKRSLHAFVAQPKPNIGRPAPQGSEMNVSFITEGESANNGKWEGTYAVHNTCSHRVIAENAGGSYHLTGQHHDHCNWYPLNPDPEIKWSW